jgi:DNA-binding MarR family transcriptional regulator
MTQQKKDDLKRQVILGARAYGIGSVLFRHVIGEMLGVSATDMECLGVIFFKGLATPSQLAQYTGLSSGATTAMLDRLEKSGLIARRPNPKDRRSTHIVVVKETAEKVAPWFASLREVQEQIVSSYSEQELELLSDFFKRSVTMWEEEREKLLKQKDREDVTRLPHEANKQ